MKTRTINMTLTEDEYNTLVNAVCVARDHAAKMRERTKSDVCRELYKQDVEILDRIEIAIYKCFHNVEAQANGVEYERLHKIEKFFKKPIDTQQD